ncbi:MAG: ATP-grasp domain-containing protein, partial [Lachnospiraceae bacterium]|nr:ATP-grasp domain-containing protein [Lachnospiraceae bacterium]
MKNFIFISPNFPTNYWKFCRELKNNGMNVLGIGDQPYDELDYNLKESLHEYYKVGSLENYDEVYRAVAFFAFKYGPIDWLESNNEYWLEQDAKLRTAFHITTGFQESDMYKIKNKSQMKAFYEKAGIPVARYYLVKDFKGTKRFISKVGYPIIAKLDNGVGASHTYKISNEEELKHFFETQENYDQFIMEEFIDGEVNSFDAIINSQGEPIFAIGNVSPISIMDIVNEQGNSVFYIVKELAADTKAAGLATLKSFGVKSRFVHFEFFRLLSDHEGLGKKGDVIALEVNMRPSGSISPDMMNYSQSTNVYKIWADMIAFDRTDVQIGETNYCGFVGRRDGKPFAMTSEDILAKYGSHIRESGRVADALSDAMGNEMYLATFPTEESLWAFYKDVLT